MDFQLSHTSQSAKHLSYRMHPDREVPTLLALTSDHQIVPCPSLYNRSNPPSSECCPDNSQAALCFQSALPHTSIHEVPPAQHKTTVQRKFHPGTDEYKSLFEAYAKIHAHNCLMDTAAQTGFPAPVQME